MKIMKHCPLALSFIFTTFHSSISLIHSSTKIELNPYSFFSLQKLKDLNSSIVCFSVEN